ncbi:GH-E family nuclease [uncultured Psychrobacter sp.]|uniref:GH-E family nuclease n=1 Tax=uncultured Psychrobacter sp. TaxID=259303 RepID=UPI00261CE6B3|nr:GH-E family nuclease [uncultured Psychrobacter sp.]
MEPPLHYGHMNGWENRRLIEASEELGMSQKQLNDYVNSKPDLFKIENGPENISHRGEKPGRGELDRIINDMNQFLKKR